MSSKTIDERVVQMQFDNSRFEKNVQQSMGTIDKLKKSLNFKDSVKDLDELDKSALGVSKGFDEVGNSLDGVANKLISLKNVFKFEVFSRIAGKVVDVAEKTIKSLTIDPILSGWSKYEEKVTSVQTIMSATASTWEANAKAIGFAGTQMEFVNAQLDKLNWFSDETSFSFTDMTSNIGKFTSAGVDLDKAVTAMEGISVWAAKSGQNAQSASRAYYNLAQAMSVGSVKLMDWKSIENANMATMEFKQTAIETAEKLKYLKKVEDGVWKTVQGGTVTVENFNEALKDEWFSSEVLMETLEEYGKAATKLSEIYDEYGITTTKFLGGLEDYQEGNKQIDEIARHLGMSVEELLPLFEELNSEEYKLSLSAFKAAQEAKTFTEVIEATKDAVSTGWMNTWEIIFGNYEEAKKLWSEMAEGFYNIFAEGGNSRNEILTSVMDSSFDKLMSKLSAVGISSEAFGTRLKEVFRESGIPIDEMIEKYGTLEEAMRHIANVKDYVIRAIESFVQPISDGANAILDVTDKLDDFQKVVNSVIRGNFGNGQERIKKLTEAGYDYATVQGLVNKIWERNNHTWKDTTITVEDLSEVMANMTDEELKNIGVTKEQAEKLQKLIAEAKESGSDLDEIINGLSKKSGRELISGTLLNFVEAINIALDSMRNTFHEVFDFNAIAGGVRAILEALYRFSEWIKMDEEQAAKFSRAFSGIVNILAIFIDLFKAIIKVFFPAFSKGLNAGINGIFDILAAFGDWIEKIRDFFRETDFFVGLLTLIKDSITSLINKIKEWLKAFREIPAVNGFIEKVYSKVKDVIDFIRKLLATFKDDVTNGGKTFAEAMSRAFSVVKENVSNFIKTNPVLKKISDILGGIVNKFKDISKNIDGGFFEGMRETATKIYEGIKNFVTKCLDKIKEMLGIHSPSKWFIDLIWNCARGIAQGIIEVTRFIVDKVTGLVTKVIDTILGLTRNEGVRESFIDTIKQTWKDAGGVRAKLVEIFDKVVEYLRKVKDWIAEAIRNIIDYFKSLNKDELKDLLLYILEVAETIAKIKALWDVGTGFKKIGQAFEDIGDGISGFFKGIKSKNTGKALLMLAASVAIITGCIIALSKLSGPEVDAALEAVGVILVIMGAILIVLSIISVINTAVGKMKLGKGEKAGLAGNGIAGFALLILSLAASLAIVLHSVDKYNELAAADTEGKLNKIILGMVGFIVAMMAIVELFTYINSKAGAEGGAFKAIGLIIALALGIKLILSTIEKTFFKKDEAGNLVYDADKVTDMAEAFIVIGEMLIVIGGVLALIAAANGGNGKGLKGAFLAVVALVVGLIVIIKMITELTIFMRSLDTSELKTLDKAIQIVLGIIVAISILLAILARTLDNENSTKGMLATSLFLFLLLAFMAGIVAALKFLEGGSIVRDIVSAAIIFAGVFGAIAAIIVILNKLSNIVGKTKPAEKRVELIEGLLKYIMGILIVLALVGAGITYAITQLRSGDIWRDLASAGIIFGGLFVMVQVIMNVVTKLLNYADKYTKPKFDNVKRLLNSLSGLMVAITFFVAALAVLIYETQWGTWESIAVAVGATVASLLIIFAAIYLMLIALEKLPDSKIKSMTGIMVSIAILVGTVAIVVGVMAGLLKDNAVNALLSAGAIALLVAAITAILWIFSKFTNQVSQITSIGLILSMALAIGVIAYSLYELSKVNTDALWDIVEAILTLISVTVVLIGALALIAGSGYGAMAILVAEAIIVALALLAAAIGYVIDKLTDLMIVIGVMAYGPEFAAAIATAFSPQPFKTFGDAATTAGGVVETAASGMASAFGGVSTAIQNLLTDGDKLGRFDWKDVFDHDRYEAWEKDVGEAVAETGAKAWENAKSEFVSYFTDYGPGVAAEEALKSEYYKKYPWKKYMDDDMYEYYKKNYPKASDEDIIQMFKDRNFLMYDSKGNVRVFAEDQKSNARKEELEAAQKANERDRIRKGQDTRNKQERGRILENMLSMEEEVAEAGKQGAETYANSFVNSLGALVTEGEYVEKISQLKNAFGGAVNIDGLSFDNLSLSGFTDINMLSEYDGVKGILSTDFLTSNNAITEITNNQGGILSAINGLISSNDANNDNMKELSGYWQTIAQNSSGTVEAINGMGVYLDGTAVGEVMSPIMDQNLMNKFVGMMRGQSR